MNEESWYILRLAALRRALHFEDFQTMSWSDASRSFLAFTVDHKA